MQLGILLGKNMSYDKQTNKQITVKYFRHYYQDFVSFGFSPEDVMKFINMGINGTDPTKTAKRKKHAQDSRNRLKPNAVYLSRNHRVEYNICN